MVRPADEDDRLRAAAFAFLGQLAARDGAVSWHDLQRFEFEGRRIPLVVQPGIRKVRGYEAALTMQTTYRLRPEDRPYQDDVGEDGYPRYKWRGTDPGHADNVALRRAMELGKPLAWLRGVGPGAYLVEAPVWLVAEEPEQHQFVLALDEIGSSLLVPSRRLARPDPELLEARYERFRAVG